MPRRKKTDNDAPVAVVPVRAYLPVDSLFRFDGKKTVYRVVESPYREAACSVCALRRQNQRLYCASFSCSPTFRDDGAFVYAQIEK